MMLYNLPYLSFTDIIIMDGSVGDKKENAHKDKTNGLESLRPKNTKFCFYM